MKKKVLLLHFHFKILNKVQSTFQKNFKQSKLITRHDFFKIWF